MGSIKRFQGKLALQTIFMCKMCSYIVSIVIQAKQQNITKEVLMLLIKKMYEFCQFTRCISYECAEHAYGEAYQAHFGRLYLTCYTTGNLPIAYRYGGLY